MGNTCRKTAFKKSKSLDSQPNDDLESLNDTSEDDAKVDTMESPEYENLSGVSRSVLQFTNDVYKIFSGGLDENFICSPLSAHTVLTMAAQGADKNTMVEMRNVLHLFDNDSELLQDYQKLVDVINVKQNADNFFGCLEALGGEENFIAIKMGSSILALANKIYMGKGIKVEESYDNVLSTFFRSKSECVDFSEPVQAVEIINKWCAENTYGKINKIVTADNFERDIALILINAVYFKGKWKHEFEAAKSEVFHLNKSSEIKVPTMYLGRGLYYRNLKNLNAQSVRIDFKWSNQYMEFIVPNEIDGLKDIEQNLNKIGNGKFCEPKVHFWLPKFEVQSTIEFRDHLEKMGMVEAFDVSLANFNKICDRRLSIGKVLQKAFIKVDEEGCEAAAVTFVEMVLRCGVIHKKEINVRADRPFLFRIMDSRLNIPLFIGSVRNPLETISQ